MITAEAEVLLIYWAIRYILIMIEIKILSKWIKDASRNTPSHGYTSYKEIKKR
jgi:hypothetical protein